MAPFGDRHGQTLSFKSRGLRDKDVDELRLDREGNHYHEVDFSQNDLSSKGLQRVLDFCHSCENIRVLKLFKNRIDDEGALGIAELIKARPSLEEIHLSHNNITGDGVQKLVSAGCSGKASDSRRAPLWLRIEQNDVSDVDQLLRSLGHNKRRVCEKKGPKCTNRHCENNCKVHIPHIRKQYHNHRDDRREGQRGDDWEAHGGESRGSIVLTARSSGANGRGDDGYRDSSYREDERRQPERGGRPPGPAYSRDFESPPRGQRGGGDRGGGERGGDRENHRVFAARPGSRGDPRQRRGSRSVTPRRVPLPPPTTRRHRRDRLERCDRGDRGAPASPRARRQHHRDPFGAGRPTGEPASSKRRGEHPVSRRRRRSPSRGPGGEVPPAKRRRHVTPAEAVQLRNEVTTSRHAPAQFPKGAPVAHSSRAAAPAAACRPDPRVTTPSAPGRPAAAPGRPAPAKAVGRPPGNFGPVGATVAARGADSPSASYSYTDDEEGSFENAPQDPKAASVAPRPGGGAAAPNGSAADKSSPVAKAKSKPPPGAAAPPPGVAAMVGLSGSSDEESDDLSDDEDEEEPKDGDKPKIAPSSAPAVVPPAAAGQKKVSSSSATTTTKAVGVVAVSAAPPAVAASGKGNLKSAPALRKPAPAQAIKKQPVAPVKKQQQAAPVAKQPAAPAAEKQPAAAAAPEQEPEQVQDPAEVQEPAEEQEQQEQEQEQEEQEQQQQEQEEEQEHAPEQEYDQEMPEEQGDMQEEVFEELQEVGQEQGEMVEEEEVQEQAAEAMDEDPAAEEAPADAEGAGEEVTEDRWNEDRGCSPPSSDEAPALEEASAPADEGVAAG